MEVLTGRKPQPGQIKAILFDFDGTISTLRCGWEKVMEPMMIEFLGEAFAQKVAEYIDESTGIQTVYQMRWLVQQLELQGKGQTDRDEWWYKDEYNRRLMETVNKRKQDLDSGLLEPDDYLILGSRNFLNRLKEAGLALYVASGTDHQDVVRENKLLDVFDLFTLVQGAPERRADCSKEAVMRMLLAEKGLQGSELVVIGDGKVEIALAAEVGAYGIGVASDELKRSGVNPRKAVRLKKAGADILTGDFENTDQLVSWILGGTE